MINGQSNRPILWWHARFWLIAGTAFAMWLVGAKWLVPMAIRSTHAGGGVALLRLAMSNASERPLDGYLETWQRLSLSLTFLAATGILLLYIVLRLLRATRVRQPDASRPDNPATSPAGTRSAWFAPIALAVWFGLLGGVGESYYTLAKARLLAEIIPRFAPTSLELAAWAPFVNAGILGVLALPVLLVRQDRTRDRALFFIFFAACFVTFLGWVRLPERVSLVPALILALGMTVQAGRLVHNRLPEFVAYTVRSIRLGVPVLLVFILCVYGSRRLPDWRTDVSPATSAPNVLLIVLDTERAQSMGLYGYAGSTTPRIEELARRGITFDEAYAPASWTLPSHAALFTGHYPVDVPAMSQAPLRPDVATLAQAFDDAGYATGGFVGNLFMLSRVFRLNRGFREWRATPVSLSSLGASMWSWRRLRQSFRRRAGKHRYIVLKDAVTVNREALAWIDRVPDDRPFFAFINYFDAHEPYTSGEWQNFETPNGARTEFLAAGSSADGYDTEEIARLRDAYDASLRYLDARVGQLMDELGRRGELDNTIVAITSDHGEHFGEHGLMDHGNSLYRSLIHVPLILIMPDGRHAGQRIDRPVAIQRLAATLAALASVPTHVEGASLLPLIEGRAPEAMPVFSFLHPDGVSVIVGTDHFIANGDGSHELYDMASDPLELHNLAEDSARAGLVERMREFIESRQRRTIHP